MTFILTALCVSPTRAVAGRFFPLVVERLTSEAMSPDRAGYLPALARYIGDVPNGEAYAILADDGEGYLSSNQLFALSEEDDDPARLILSEKFREPFKRVVQALMAASRESRILLVIEENGHVTDLSLSNSEAETVDVVGPISEEEFWARVQLGEVVEDSIVTIEQQ